MVEESERHARSPIERAPLTLAIGLVLAAVSAAQQAAPRFVAGDLGQLSCRVRRIDAGVNFTNIVEIEVHNKSTLYVEPLAFRVSARAVEDADGPVEIDVRRVEYPIYGRAGRSVQPRRKLVYAIPIDFTPRSRRDLRVDVVEASFIDGEPLRTPEIKLSDRKVDKGVDFFGGRDVQTSFRVWNPTDYTVDAIFEAEFAGRHSRGRSLLFLQIGPREARRWQPRIGTEAMLSGTTTAATPWGGNGDIPGDGEIRSLKLIDWSIVASAGSEDALAVARPALASWYRWSDDVDRATGGFRGVRRTRSGEDAVTEQSFAGRFVARRDGVVDFELDRGDDSTRDVVGRAFGSAFSDYVRLGLDQLLATHDVSLAALGPPLRVEVRPRPDAAVAKPWLAGWVSDRFFDFDEGRIKASANAYSGSFQIVSQWTTEAHDESWLVTSRRLERRIGQRLTPYSEITYTPVQVDGVWLPGRYVSRSTDPDASSQSELELELVAPAIHRTEAAGAAPTASPELTRLRTAWDLAYRHPVEPHDLVARLDIEPGDDASWRRRKRLTAMVRFGGLRSGGKAVSWDTLDVQLDATVPADDRGPLADLVRARLSAWGELDPAGRLDAAQTLRAAVATADPVDPNVINLVGAPLLRAELDGPRIRRLVWPDGSERRYEYVDVGGKPCTAAVEVRRGAWFARLEIEPVAVGNLVFPAALVLRDWTRKGDPAEHYRFSDVRIAD